jgi:predicted RNase H-like nuclease (RuvC/YqgF family)
MRRTLSIIVAVSVAFILACGKAEESPQPKKPVTEEKVMKEVKEAVRTALAYTEQQKEEYQKKINAQLDEMQKKMAALKAKAEQAKPEMQAKLKAQMDALRKEVDAAQKKIEELKAASGKAWEDMKAGLDKALEDLKKSDEKTADSSQ